MKGRLVRLRLEVLRWQREFSLNGHEMSKNYIAYDCATSDLAHGFSDLSRACSACSPLGTHWIYSLLAWYRIIDSLGPVDGQLGNDVSDEHSRIRPSERSRLDGPGKCSLA